MKIQSTLYFSFSLLTMDKGNILGNVVSNDERYKDVRENNIVEDSYDANLTKQVERTILRPKTAFFHISYVMDNLKDFQCQVSPKPNFKPKCS